MSAVSQADPTVAFAEAMASAGIRTADPIIGDGKLRRFHIEGHRAGTKNGHYVLHLDHPASGAFGDFKAGLQDTWTVERPDRMTDDDRNALARRMADTARQRREELEAAQAMCREAAAAIMAACEPAKPDHPYLVRKGISGAPGLRQLARDVKYKVADPEKPNRTARKGVLVIPIYGADKTLHSVQTIDADGRKHFLSGTNKRGHYWSLGKLTPRIIIAEGFSTAATIYRATGCCTVIAFDSGNLKPVAQAIRAKFPEHEIVIGADNDRMTMKPVPNPGMTKACEAAAEVNGLVAWPEFEDGVTLAGDSLPTDFNDLAAIRGNLESVGAAFEAAMRPADIENHADPRRAGERQPAQAPDGTRPDASTDCPPPTTAVAAQHDVPPEPVEDKTPTDWASSFARWAFGHAGRATLACHRSEWLSWRGGAWKPLSEDEIAQQAYAWGQRVNVHDLKTGLPAPMRPDRRKITDLLHALRAQVAISDAVEMPSLLGNLDIDPARAMAVGNGILDLRNRRLIGPSPLLFTDVASEIEYSPRAAKPFRWLEFLHELWPDDAESQETLQEFAGYLLTTDVRLHRALLVIGPPRAGKGTIADVLSNLVGRAAVAAPTLGSLATSFGLQPLIGKRLALVADAHLSGRADEALIVEHLKTITGGDWQSISRKGIGAWHGRLGVRFCIFANEMLNLRDASGALASRFVVLKLTQSFAGREDIRLADQLREELPGILEWALDGLDRLRARQSFRQPRSALDAVGDIQRMGSPVATFVDERCVVSEDASVLCSVLYAEWRQWCAAMGLEPGGANTLSRRLKSACPDIETVKETSGARGLLYRGLRLL